MENKEKTFEQLMKELEETVSKLENRDIALDEAINAYKKGLDLSKELNDILERNQKLVTEKMTEQGLEPFNEE